MNQFSDQSLAKQLLEAREHGITFRRYFRKTIAYHLLFILCLSLMIYFGWPKYCEACQVAHDGNWLMVGFAFGLLYVYLLFILMLRAAKKRLPFQLKVTDWDKVQKLANGEDVG
jgi:hypothetical protein